LLEGDAPAGQREVDAGGGKSITFGDVAALLTQQYPESTVSFTADPGSVPVPAANTVARQFYDWVAMHELDHDFAGVAKAIVTARPRKPSVMSQVKGLLFSRKWIIQILEILLSFILMEYLVTVTGDTLQFKFIDIRLLFVVIIGVIHGLRSGVIAALLACVSIIIAYISMKMDWRAVVYNVNNWLPFVAYLLTGAVTGYLRDKNDSALDFAKQKSDAQEKHYSFL
jgi:UDP-glucose 4-epimerase